MPVNLQLRALTALESIEDAEAAAEAYIAYDAAKAAARAQIKVLDQAALEGLGPWIREHGAMELLGKRITVGKKTDTKSKFKGKEMADKVMTLCQGDITKFMEALSSDAFKQGYIKKELGKDVWAELFFQVCSDRLGIKAVPVAVLEEKR